jgi:hypothetical protein
MSVTQLAPKKIDERAELRRAIAAVAEARAEVAAIRDAVERAEYLAMAGRAKLDVARKAIVTAKARDAEELAAALVRGAGSTPVQMVQRARAEETAAVDALEASRAAITKLEANLKRVEYEVERADKGVRDAVAAIMAPFAEKMRAEARDLRSKYLMRMYVIGAMVESRLDGVAPVLFDIREEEHRQFCAAVLRPWVDAIEALMRDADAPLPAIKD